MPPFRKPSPSFPYKVADELAALVAHKKVRGVPGKRSDRLLLATWNIANLGVQKRRDTDYQLLAQIIGWFDLLALQECSDNLEGLRTIESHLPKSFRALFSDPGGNNERYVFLYDSNRVKLLEKVGELTVPPKDLRNVKLPGVSQPFTGFDRNPYLAAFEVDGFRFLPVNVHLYFGEAGADSGGMERRCLEAFAVAHWAKRRHQSAHAYTKNIVALGDFNIPMDEPGDRVYDALTSRGLRKPDHSTKVASNIKNDAHYDQMAMFPGKLNKAVQDMGVFDFDGAVFAKFWDPTKQKLFEDNVKYYLSDHRPLWAQLDLIGHG